MNRKLFKGAAVLASAAALSMAATPALARDGWGWGGGWGRHHDRVDAGDVIAGILIIGGIAAVASAASKASKNRRDDDNRYPRDRDYRGEDYRGQDYRGEDYRSEGSRGGYGASYSGDMNDAVNRCIDEVNRGKSRVESVDGAERDGSGWRVRGRVDGNEQFSCAIDGDGRIRQVSIDGHAA